MMTSRPQLERDIDELVEANEALRVEIEQKSKLIDLIAWIVNEPAYENDTRCMARIGEEIERYRTLSTKDKDRQYVSLMGGEMWVESEKGASNE